MTLEEAIKLLRNAVKDSHLDNQKHIDLTLVDASVRADYEKALMFCRVQVAQGLISDEDLKIRLGLNA
ncbi:MAG: hypothetical protein K9K67_13505 [Bacteriovoracaceae bacterium]|nr:hypothetical protein [Bacteriovoracaceae bacterium]